MNGDGLRCPVCGLEPTKVEEGIDQRGFEFEKYQCTRCGSITTKYHAKPTTGGEEYEPHH